jgi:hypothetical protein
MARYENAKHSDGSKSGHLKGVTGSYGMSRGSKGVEKTVVQEKDPSYGGGEAEVSAAASSIYRNAVANKPGESGASIRALQER